jgi:hypothetical protein
MNWQPVGVFRSPRQEPRKHKFSLVLALPVSRRERVFPVAAIFTILLEATALTVAF